jgi:hypothetical protein
LGRLADGLDRSRLFILSMTFADIARRLSSTNREHLDRNESCFQFLLLGGGVLLT